MTGRRLASRGALGSPAASRRLLSPALIGPPEKLPLERHVRHPLRSSIVVQHDIEVSSRTELRELVKGRAILQQEIQNFDDKVGRESVLAQEMSAA